MNDKANELCLTMKGIALMKLVEAGVIRREEDGNVNTDGLKPSGTASSGTSTQRWTTRWKSCHAATRAARRLPAKQIRAPTTALVRESFMVKSLSSRRWRWYSDSSWRFCW